MEKEEARKGPWTEQEDVQLVFYVNLFGDRRWDFIAKVSGLKVAGEYRIVIGLKRTGKSCRLRWVNYLHPGLKRSKMTPHEERLVLQLHNKWGNRWSRIARKLPGRTDNEIKNYWRTHMRKMAQDKKKPNSPSSPSSSSSNSSSSTISNSPSVVFPRATPTKECGFYDTGGKDSLGAPGVNIIGLEVEESTKAYSMDEIWKDIEMSEDSFNISTGQESMGSPIWDYCSLWSMNEESKMLSDHFQYAFPFCNNMIG